MFALDKEQAFTPCRHSSSDLHDPILSLQAPFLFSKDHLFFERFFFNAPFFLNNVKAPERSTRFSLGLNPGPKDPAPFPLDGLFLDPYVAASFKDPH